MYPSELELAKVKISTLESEKERLRVQLSLLTTREERYRKVLKEISDYYRPIKLAAPLPYKIARAALEEEERMPVKIDGRGELVLNNRPAEVTVEELAREIVKIMDELAYSKNPHMWVKGPEEVAAHILSLFKLERK
jgi:hypothetical protein